MDNSWTVYSTSANDFKSLMSMWFIRWYDINWYYPRLLELGPPASPFPNGTLIPSYALYRKSGAILDTALDCAMPQGPPTQQNRSDMFRLSPTITLWIDTSATDWQSARRKIKHVHHQLFPLSSSIQTCLILKSRHSETVMPAALLL